MKTAIDSIETLMAHPSPGIVFAPHKMANLPRRAYPTCHAWGEAMTAAEREELMGLCIGNAELADLLELYRRSNGIGLFALRCQYCGGPHCNGLHWGILLLPVSEWGEAAACWKPGGDCASFMDECELFKQGEWRTIASLGRGSMLLVQFFSGEHKGEKLVGKVFCIGLGGVLGFEEEVAPNLSALMEEIARDTAAFFDRIGLCWGVETAQGSFGDPIERYIPDLRGHPDAQSWPAPSATPPNSGDR